MEEYSFKRLNANNLNDLITLFLSFSKRGVSYKKFIAKYNTKYTGVNAIGYLAYYNDSTPVAFYGVIPCLAQVKGKTIKIAQATDALTHPNHQRKGLFSRLVLMTYAWAKEEEINFIYGVPNNLSFQVYMDKLKWVHSGNMQIFKWQVLTLPASYFFKKFQLFNPIYRFYINIILFFYKKSVFFSNPNCFNNYFGLLRNNEYFNYKEYQKKYLIRIKGITIWISIDGALKIGDIEKVDHFDYFATLKSIKKLAFLLGTNKVVMQYSPNSYWANILNIYHSPEIGLPIIFLNLTNVYNHNDFVFSYGDIDTF